MNNKRAAKSKAVLRCVMFSIIFMLFPVLSGVIVAINSIAAPKSYWIQGAFILISTAVPVIVMFITKTNPRQIGFSRTEKGGIKAVSYFIPLIAAKMGFLFFGLKHDMQTVISLIFFTLAIGLAEELYFRGTIFNQLGTYFTTKQAVVLSSVLFASAHASQAFSGEGPLMVALTVVNAFIFGIVSSEIVVITGSLIPVMIWHASYDFINWISYADGTAEVILIVIQSIIMIAYGLYLWTKLPLKKIS